MNTLTLTADEVELIAKAVVPAAASDQMMPIFTYVQIAAHEGSLAARATDRYVMSRARLRDFEPPEGFSPVLVPAAWFAHVVSAFRLRDRRLMVDLSVDLAWSDEDGVTFRASGMPKARGLGDRKITIEFSYTDSPGEFPKIQHLVKDLAHKDAEFLLNVDTMPSASVMRANRDRGREVRVIPPDGDRKQFAFAAADGSWVWVGQPMRSFVQYPAESEAVAS